MFFAKKTVERYKVLSAHFGQMRTVMFRTNNICMIKFFVDRNTSCDKQRRHNATNKPSVVDASFKNTRNLAETFLESKKLVRH
jgi:hypothetical protein